MADLSAIFVNRESGARAKVTGVDDSYAYLAVENPDGRPSHFAMPIAEYDSDVSVPVQRRFSSIWRPATAEDFENDSPPAEYRPPKPAPEVVEVMERVGIGGEIAD